MCSQGWKLRIMELNTHISMWNFLLHIYLQFPISSPFLPWNSQVPRIAHVDKLNSNSTGGSSSGSPPPPHLYSFSSMLTLLFSTLLPGSLKIQNAIFQLHSGPELCFSHPPFHSLNQQAPTPCDGNVQAVPTGDPAMNLTISRHWQLIALEIQGFFHPSRYHKELK